MPSVVSSFAVLFAGTVSFFAHAADNASYTMADYVCRANAIRAVPGEWGGQP